MTVYFKELKANAEKVKSVLSAKGIDEKYLRFGGEGLKSNKKVKVPTVAFSNFLANRAMGDWAEEILSTAINETSNEYKAIHYGDSDDISAGEEGFEEFYLNRIDDVRLYGKRPDLLIVGTEIQSKRDVSKISTIELKSLVSKSLGAIEVRSSKIEAHKYIEARRKQREAGVKRSPQTPSFTVKVEDLIIVYRWMQLFKCKQVYCQVFFDSVFAIDVLRIFEIISEEKGNWKIETPANSQLKATIMIPITEGVQVGEITQLPLFEARDHVDYLGTHKAYVVPTEGQLELDFEKLLAILTQK